MLKAHVQGFHCGSKKPLQAHNFTPLRLRRQAVFCPDARGGCYTVNPDAPLLLRSTHIPVLFVQSRLFTQDQWSLFSLCYPSALPPHKPLNGVPEFASEMSSLPHSLGTNSDTN